MGAHRTILTHFSQRYPALSPLPTDVSGRVLVAFDLLSVSFSDLRWAPYSVPVLRCMFPPEEITEENVEEGGEAAAKSSKAKLQIAEVEASVGAT